jgi:hypothetical protein
LLASQKLAQVGAGEIGDPMQKKLLATTLFTSLLLGVATGKVTHAVTTGQATGIVKYEAPLGSVAALAQKKLSERKVPKVLSQQEIDLTMQKEKSEPQQNITPDSGFGVVVTALANQNEQTCFVTLIQRSTITAKNI